MKLIFYILRQRAVTTPSVGDYILSYDVAVIQWITSCHKNCMITRVITLWRVDVTTLTTSVSTMRFLFELLSIFKAIKADFKGSYDKQNLTLVERAFGEFHKFHMK